MRNLNLLFVFAIISILSTSCNKDDCQTCSHYQGGVAGGSINEERIICDKKEAADLEASSKSINDYWSCE